MKDGTGTPYRNNSGYPHDARFQWVNRDVERFYRFELGWEANENLQSHFLAQGGAHKWLDVANRDLEAHRCGSLVEIARRLEVAYSGEQLYWDKKSFVRLYAPVTAAFESIDIRPDRTIFDVRLLRGLRLDSSRLEVFAEQTDEYVDRPQVAAGFEGECVTFEAPRADKVTFQISYAGKTIQRETVEVPPRLSANPRLTALRAFEGKANLFDDGLSASVTQRGKAPEDAFERSVCHLLSLLGFSALWWGRHKGNSLAVPEDQADLLAFSADNSVVLVVDCTLQPSQDLKTSKLIHRARLIAEKLRDTSNLPPRVEPILAIGVPRRAVASILRRPDGDSEVTVLAADHIQSALEALNEGRPHSEIQKLLPEAIASGFSAMGNSRLWPWPL